MRAITAADCERVQRGWNEAVARAGGGRVWHDGDLAWSWQPHDGQLMLNFPRKIELDAVRRGVDAARRLGAGIVGAWLAEDVAGEALEAAGFERGWSPLWMQRALDDQPHVADPRVTLTSDVGEYDDGGRRLLALTDGTDAPAWHAVARLDGELAGRAFAFRLGDLAGIFDMDVWPQHQRRGLGRALLAVLCDAARAAGARAAVLNATPEGERLYRAEGFTVVGEGVTFWHHLR